MLSDHCSNVEYLQQVINTLLPRHCQDIACVTYSKARTTRQCSGSIRQGIFVLYSKLHGAFDQCVVQNVLCRVLLVRESLVLCTPGVLYLEREHVSSSQDSDWLLSKSTFPSQIAGGETSRTDKRTVARESCTLHYGVIKIRVESRALHAHSCDN